MSPVEVVLYTKRGCCLCDEVKTKLQNLRLHHAFDLREVNIDQDAQAYEKYRDEIPVVFINGRKACKYHLDEKEFIRRLSIADRRLQADAPTERKGGPCK